MIPHGLEIRLSWGDHVLAEHFLPPDREASFTVGSAPGCTFAMGDLAGPRFEVARVGPDGCELRFAPWMAGEVVRGDVARELSELISSGEVVPDGDGDGGCYAVALDGEGASARLELGEITLQAALRPCPERVRVPFPDTIDFRSLNILLVLFALAGAFVIHTLNREVEGEGLADDIFSGHKAVVARLLIAPVPRRAPGVPQPDAQPPAAEGARTRSGRGLSRRPDVSPRAKAYSLTERLVSGIGGAFATLMGDGEAAQGELKKAISGFVGPGVTTASMDPGAFGGLGLKGTGSGATPGGPVTIGGLGARGRRFGRVPDWGLLCDTPCGVRREPIQVAAEEVVIGGLDRELVRTVIHAHRQQIRYCYERELTRAPTLSGKLAVKFVISAEGHVASATATAYSMESPELEACVVSRVRSWIFPRPKGGGVAVVTYPFVFAQSGS